MSKTNYLVKEVTVSGIQKAWGTNHSAGNAGGTEVTFTVIPADQNQLGWTPQEANVVALDCRLQCHVLLQADAQLRKIPLPPGAEQSLSEYREKIDTLKSQLGDRVSWKEAILPEPEVVKS
jgi:hypothetical protein